MSADSSGAASADISQDRRGHALEVADSDPRLQARPAGRSGACEYGCHTIIEKVDFEKRSTSAGCPLYIGLERVHREAGMQKADLLIRGHCGVQSLMGLEIPPCTRNAGVQHGQGGSPGLFATLVGGLVWPQGVAAKHDWGVEREKCT